jgi:hypothetical protein
MAEPSILAASFFVWYLPIRGIPSPIPPAVPVRVIVLAPGIGLLRVMLLAHCTQNVLEIISENMLHKIAQSPPSSMRRTLAQRLLIPVSPLAKDRQCRIRYPAIQQRQLTSRQHESFPIIQKQRFVTIIDLN